MFRDDKPLDWEPDGNSSQCGIRTPCLKDHPSAKKIKDFWEDNWSQRGKWQCKICAKIKLLSSFSNLFFIEKKLFLNRILVDVKIHLCKLEEFWKNHHVCIYSWLHFHMYSPSTEFFIYLMTSHMLQQIFLTLGMGMNLSGFKLFSPVSGPESLLNFWRNTWDLKTLQLNRKSAHGQVERDAKWK